MPNLDGGTRQMCTVSSYKEKKYICLDQTNYKSLTLKKKKTVIHAWTEQGFLIER